MEILLLNNIRSDEENSLDGLNRKMEMTDQKGRYLQNRS